MRLDVQVSAKSALDRLASIAAAATNPHDAFVEVGDVFLEREANYFRTAPWKPLRPDSVRRKRKRGRGSRPLVGGVLEKSLTRKAVNYSVRRISASAIVMGTRDPVAHLHHKGTRGHLPARPLLTNSVADKTAYRLVFARHLIGIRSGRGRTRSWSLR